jgi:LysR family transcriptional activator of nhaA
MAWLNYHHLMYFKTIATEGSISKASEKLTVGQPALSAQLKQLEEQFEQKLFERRNRRLILTDAGKAALKYANQIASLGSELQEVLRDQSYATRPHLNIGALDSVPKNLVVRLVEEARKLKDCQVMTVDGAGDELYRQLVSHSLDLVVSNHHIMGQEDKTVYSRRVGKMSVNIYGAMKFKSLGKGFPSSLHGQPMILPTIHSKLRNDLELYFEQNGIHPNIVAEAQDTSIQKILAQNRHGLIAEPDLAVRSLVKEKKLIKIGELKGVFEEFFLISARRTVSNPLANELMNSFSFG